MRKIINGKRYDTEAAREICRLTCACDGSDFGWHDTRLYRSPRGAWFLAGEGNASSMWAQRAFDGRIPGQGVRPLTDDEARSIMETEGETDAIEEFFEIEDA